MFSYDISKGIKLSFLVINKHIFKNYMVLLGIFSLALLCYKFYQMILCKLQFE